LLQNEGDTKVNEVEIRAQMSYLTLSYCVDILLAESVQSNLNLGIEIKEGRTLRCNYS